MITTAVTNSAKLEFLYGLHSSEDIYRIALYDLKANLSATTERYVSENEVTGKGYKSGGIALSGYAIKDDNGTAVLTFDDPEWENATITASGALIYNSSKDNRALAVFDFGENVTSTNGTFAVAIPTATAAKGLIRIL